MESPVLIPGSFMAEHDTNSQATRCRTSIFISPTDDSPHASTPTSNSFSSQPISNFSNFTEHNNGRKRPRLGATSSRGRNPSALRRDSYISKQSLCRDALSPPPFVSTNYRMAGGLDAQVLSMSQQEEDEREYDYEVDCRPNRFTQKSSQPTDSYFPDASENDSYFPASASENLPPEFHLPYTPGVNGTGQNKRKQPSSPPKGWGKTVWALTGGIAGKVINFCWNTTFAGFHAGGGNGYRFDIGTPDVAAGNAWTEVDAHQDVFHADYDGLSDRRQRRELTPVPGGFPEEQPTFIEDYMSNPSGPRMHNPDSTPTMNVQGASSSISHNDWVVIDRSGESTSREDSPVRKKSRASTANLYYARPAPARHASASARPRLVSRSTPHNHKSTASFASPRISSLNTSNTFSSSMQPRQPLSASGGAGNANLPAHGCTPPSLSKRPSITGSRASLASPRRYASQPAAMCSAVSQSPKASPEVRKFEQKLRRKEAKQDQTMSRFNAQLEAMIREGQQALGSTIEVDLEGGTEADGIVVVDEKDEDEGYGYGEDNVLRYNKVGGMGKRHERGYVRPGVWA
ncbi:hypothetical protein A1O1_03499 [Capronia coronata CBS 617.96]|uniref:Uncharacterized protein n=1 Tax=Capronia coronata CBS 617.96 TaxID=1182541 RepID=W9YD30_9EURO|nr:uncharacterized protein A1O1_03499 [Capronia coronata CBS 617.96]EXJ90398.1 hypothetical protein A1O1_03499 [Capronia coronata CBS 617.96]